MAGRGGSGPKEAWPEVDAQTLKHRGPMVSEQLRVKEVLKEIKNMIILRDTDRAVQALEALIEDADVDLLLLHREQVVDPSNVVQEWASVPKCSRSQDFGEHTGAERSQAKTRSVFPRRLPVQLEQQSPEKTHSTTSGRTSQLTGARSKSTGAATARQVCPAPEETNRDQYWLPAGSGDTVIRERVDERLQLAMKDHTRNIFDVMRTLNRRHPSCH
eukprot:TRINITY_DN56998_c0_g1_i1.p1 TRINITY_DN56998_c0_g1~~TRINITY_DN56998_c0_g1_i1.p1  ORF type:complete len:216 (+),score=29.64 TRINITY_DN56998_c0_g1_i1:114-761(+)